MNKILLLIPYFGKFPADYFELFLHSCAQNTNLEFLILTDTPAPARLPDNVRFAHITMAGFNALASAQLGVQVNVTTGYKLCDLRPMYGVIFSEYLHGYDFWGHCDMDLLLGNTRAYLTESVLAQTDIFSVRKEWISGSFALYRNSQEVNSLYTYSRDWQRIATESEYLRFDECGVLRGTKAMAYSMLAKGQSILDLDLEIQSISYVAELVKQGKLPIHIRLQQQTLAKESIVAGTILQYQHGAISVHTSSEARHPAGMEFLHYHYITEKYNRYFQFPRWANVPATFYIDETGFYTEADFANRATLYAQRRRAGDWRYYLGTLPRKIWKKITG